VLTRVQAYHSALNEESDIRQVGNLGIYPIKTRLRGPAPLAGAFSPYTSYPFSCIIDLWLFISASNEQGDIIDETLDLFRANSLFRNFEIKGPGDRLLIILILFISDCLAKLGSARTPPTQIEASKSLNTLAVDNFPIPGDANFLLNAHYAPPISRADAGELPEEGGGKHY
jgi:actin related protein 2/3 complex subunit 3